MTNNFQIKKTKIGSKKKKSILTQLRTPNKFDPEKQTKI